MKRMQNTVAVAMTALALAAPMSNAASAEAAKPKKPAAEKTVKKKHTAPKFVNSASQESTAERDRRLYRECKGRPNAGACSGYAS